MKLLVPCLVRTAPAFMWEKTFPINGFGDKLDIALATGELLLLIFDRKRVFRFLEDQ